MRRPRVVVAGVSWLAPRLLAACLLSSASCQQASRTPPAPRPSASTAAAPAAPPLGAPLPAPSLDPSSLDPEGCRLRLANPPGDLDDHPGPAYVDVHGGLLRIAPSGMTLLPDSFVGVTRVVAAPRGEIRFADDRGVHVLEPGSPTPRLVAPAVAGMKPHQLVVDAAGDLWGLWIEGELATMKSWAIVRHDDRGGARRGGSEFTGPNERPWPDSIAATSEGLWVSTSNGLWRAAGGDWQKVEAGDDVPRGLSTSGDRLVGIRGHGPGTTLVVRENGAWRSLPWRPGDGSVPFRVLTASPSGLLVVGGFNHALSLGSLDGDCEPIPLGGALQGRWPLNVAIDGRNRVWLSTGHGLVVVDRAGRVLADYLPWTLPGLTGPALGLAIPSAGPDVLPTPMARRRLDVVGQLFASRYAPIAGATVRIEVGAVLQRETMTDANGIFRLSDVPEGRYRVDVKPRPGTRGCHFSNTLSDFELNTAIECPPDLVGTVCEIGQRRPCRDGGRIP